MRQCTMARNMKFVADCLITECEGKSFDLVALPSGMPGTDLSLRRNVMERDEM